MSARLDGMAHFGDYAGGVSDPRMVNQLDLVHPAGPPTDLQIDLAVKVIDRYATRVETSTPEHHTTRQLLLEMLGLPDTATRKDPA